MARGAVFTDVDGTVVREVEGRIHLPPEVDELLLGIEGMQRGARPHQHGVRVPRARRRLRRAPACFGNNFDWSSNWLSHHASGGEYLESFLRGYGISPQAYAEAPPYMRAINVLNYAPAIEMLARQKDRERLAWYRVRLQGMFDLCP